MKLTDKEFDILTEILNQLIDNGGKDENHPFAYVMSAIADVMREEDDK